MKGVANLVRSNRKDGPTAGAVRLAAAIAPMLAEGGGQEVKIDYVALSARFGVQGSCISKWLAELADAGMIRRCRTGYYAPVSLGEAERLKSAHPAIAADAFIRPIPLHRLMAGRA